MVVGQDKVNTARYSTARIFSPNLFENSHGQRTVRAVPRGIPTTTFRGQLGFRKLSSHPVFLRLTTAIALSPRSFS